MVQANNPVVLRYHQDLDNINKRTREMYALPRFVRLEIPVSHPKDFAFIADQLRGLASTIEQSHLRTERADGRQREPVHHLVEMVSHCRTTTMRLKAHCKDYDIA